MKVARAIKTKVIRKEDNLVDVVVSSILKDMKTKNYEINDKDVICITESIVSITNNNFCHINDIKDDLNSKFKGDNIGIVFPILSRNRFSIILKGIARAKKNLTILLSYPSDEVGNLVLDEKKLDELNLKGEMFDEEFYYKHFKNFVHPWTKLNMVSYYKDVIENEGSSVAFIFSNNPEYILKYTKNILVSNIHTRFNTYKAFQNTGDVVLYRLDEILNKSINNSGYNKLYGLLGSNLMTKETLKLFPNENLELLKEIQRKIYKETKKHVEVMIYGDGAFKDPYSKIWELADPVVSPSYTEGLEGSPNDVKLKYLAENEFKHLTGEELNEAIKNYKNESKDSNLGTTPRRYVDLLGSLADLMSGSGSSRTPVILIQNYFD